MRHLRPQQVAAQIAQRLRGPARTPRCTHASGITGLASCPTPLFPSPEGQLTPEGIALVGRPPHDPRRQGWDRGANPLWAYTLHYHGWLNAPECTADHARATMLGWIEDHPRGVGWEPYPTSMRVLHWLGWLHRHGVGLQAFERERIFGSLAAQLQHLAANVETHIDGNHLWTNLAALTAAGVALRGPLPRRLLQRFEARMITTIGEQLCADGTHAERTPSYHCLLTEQLAIVAAYAQAQRPTLHQALTSPLDAMVAAMAAFTHPDGDVALWGDSQHNAPVTPAALLSRLGRSVPRGHADAPVGGFSRRRWGPLTLLWNRGDVGLAHQVGHVHGDALAIELSVGATRVLVDAGVGTYESGPERRYSRSTAAHNTVTVGAENTDHHELWASHRIGARAQPETIACAERRIVARVQGHASPTAHQRSIEFVDGVVRITDTVDDPQVPAVARYFVPQSCPTTVSGDRVEIEAAGRRVVLRSVRGPWRCEPAAGWSGMGRPTPRQCLSLPLSANGAVVEIEAP